MTLSTLLVVLAGLAVPPGVKPIVVRIEENVRGARHIVEGTVLEPPAECDGRTYPLRVEKVYYGDLKRGDEITVSSVSDWTCCRRFRPYRKNGRLLVFLIPASRGNPLDLYAAHFSEFVFLGDGKLRGCDAFYGSRIRSAEGFRELVTELVRFAGLKERDKVVETWLRWMNSKNLELRRFAADRAYSDIRFAGISRMSRIIERRKGRLEGPSMVPLQKLVDSESSAAFYAACARAITHTDRSLRETAARSIGYVAELVSAHGPPEGFDLVGGNAEALKQVEILIAEERNDWEREQLRKSADKLRNR